MWTYVCLVGLLYLFVTSEARRLLPPVDIEPYVVASNYVAFRWNDTSLFRANGKIRPRTYVVRYRPVWQESETYFQYLDSDKQSVIVDHLRPNTEYNFYFSTNEKLRQSHWSQPTALKTSKKSQHKKRDLDRFSHTVEDVRVISLSSSVLLVTWEYLFPKSKEDDCDGHQYVVKYRSTDLPNAIYEFITTGGTSVLIKGLMPATQYGVAVQVKTSKRESAWSNIVVGETKSDNDTCQCYVRSKPTTTCKQGYRKCQVDPCKLDTILGGCQAYPNAKCKNNYCGGCNADYYHKDKKVDCKSWKK